MTTEHSPDNEATLRVRDPDLAAAVLSRVVGMLAARADCPIDRLDDAMLLTDAVAAHFDAHSPSGELQVRITTSSEELGLEVGPLGTGAAESLRDAADVPGIGNVFERIADEVRTERGQEGDHLIIRLNFAR